MRRQRGSVLVGVIALSLSMTLIAGGVIVMSVNSSTDEANSRRDIQMHYAAESGMQMGLYWARYYEKIDLEDPDWKKPEYVLSQTDNHGTPGFADINGMKVRVALVARVGGAGPPHTLEVLVKDGINPGILKVTWDINSADAFTDADHDVKSRPSASNWKETYLPNG